MAFRAVSFDDAAKKRITLAASFEKRQRLEAFLEIPTEIGPFKLFPLKVKDILVLEYAENKFLDEGDPNIDDVVHLLWTLRGDDTREIKKFTKWVCRKINPFLKNEISAFFSVQFNDMPGCDSSGMKNEYESSVWLASLIDGISSEYGWTLDQTLDTPLATSLQLFQRIIKRNNPKYAIRNGITQAAKAYEMKGMFSRG